MEMEFRRELEWGDWKGARYTLAEEWEYCLGESVERRDCTAGHRDCGRGGLRLDDYERLAEEYVSSRSPAGRWDGYYDTIRPTAGAPLRCAGCVARGAMLISRYSGLLSTSLLPQRIPRDSTRYMPHPPRPATS